jgi:cell division protein FtsB
MQTYVELITLVLVIVVHIVYISSLLSNLKQRVVALEKHSEKEQGNNRTLVEIETKVDLLYKLLIEDKHK